MTDTSFELRLARLEATQTEWLNRLARFETTTPTGHPAPIRQTASRDNIGWMRIGVIALIVLAAAWLIERMPGPPFWERLF